MPLHIVFAKQTEISFPYKSMIYIETVDLHTLFKSIVRDNDDGTGSFHSLSCVTAGFRVSRRIYLVFFPPFKNTHVYGLHCDSYKYSYD